jgi:hypothetical protein
MFAQNHAARGLPNESGTGKPKMQEYETTHFKPAQKFRSKGTLNEFNPLRRQKAIFRRIPGYEFEPVEPNTSVPSASRG